MGHVQEVAPVAEAPRLSDQDFRHAAFERLRAALPAGSMDAVLRSAARLRSTTEETGRLPGTVVLVAYGGGKDSSYAVAFVRCMQLVLERIYGTTFRMRVMTSRHPGMPPAVMENIGRIYRVLELDVDPLCELLLVDGDRVSPFRVDLPLPEEIISRSRSEILMTGHRAAGDGRPTFCNACNLNMVRAFGIAASYGDGVDIIVTGDSQDEQRAYYLWASKLARQLKVSPRSAQAKGFGRMMAVFGGISQAYFAEINGQAADRQPAWHYPETRKKLKFFSIYEETSYASGSHWDFLTGHLGFKFDDLAFSFSETDCGNPGLMAHLRGLKSEHRYRRSYAAGLSEYAAFAIRVMQKKDFPAQLVEAMRSRYAGSDGVRRMREMMADYAIRAYNLTEEQLICMTFTPFVEKGASLGEYLIAEQPHLLDRTDDIHRLLASDHDGDGGASDNELMAALERMSGLTLPQLRTLYLGESLHHGGPDGRTVLSLILADDPHKETIRTRHSPDGPEVDELISGR